MQTEIILKDYSELSIYQKMLFNGYLPALYQVYEEGFQSMQSNAEEATSKLENEIFQATAEILAQLMAYYNSDDLADYRAFHKSFDYLQSILNNSRASITKKFVAERLFDDMKEVAVKAELVAEGRINFKWS